jgi:hypothetical protein
MVPWYGQSVREWECGAGMWRQRSSAGGCFINGTLVVRVSRLGVRYVESPRYYGPAGALTG